MWTHTHDLFPYLKVLQYVSNLAVYRLCITWKQSGIRLSAARLQKSSFCCCFLKKVEIWIIYWRKWKPQFHKPKQQETGSSPCRNFYLRTGRWLSWWSHQTWDRLVGEKWFAKQTIPRKQGPLVSTYWITMPLTSIKQAHAHVHTH